MIFEGGAVFDVRPPRIVSADWRRLADEFFLQIDHPGQAQLVVTDRYERVVHDWQQQTPSEFGDQGSATYVADKIDGARAAAKTVVLDRQRCVVVASVDTLEMGWKFARWMLTHEAQHVRLHEQKSAAWAVHRRSGQAIISSRPWEFVWSAQSAIDEYRCERAVHAKLLPVRPTYTLGDFHAMIRRLGEARAAWTSRGSLDPAYAIVAQVIDRLSVISAYSAAAIDSGHDSEERWSGAYGIERIWACLRRSPTVDQASSPRVLWDLSSEIAEKLDQLLRHARVELTFTDDQLALYFR